MRRRHLLAAPLLPILLRSETLADSAKRESTMSEPMQRLVETNGIRLNIAKRDVQDLPPVDIDHPDL